MPGVSLDLWEFKLSIVWIHTLDFLTSWRPKYLVDNNINSAGSTKKVIEGWFQSSDKTLILFLLHTRLRKFYFDYLNKLINSAFTWKERLPRFNWPKGKEQKTSVQSCSFIAIHQVKDQILAHRIPVQEAVPQGHNPQTTCQLQLCTPLHQIWVLVLDNNENKYMIYLAHL